MSDATACVNRGDARTTNPPLRTIEVGDGDHRQPLTEALAAEGVDMETFDIEGPTFYYIPAMMYHEFIDRSSTKEIPPRSQSAGQHAETGQDTGPLHGAGGGASARGRGRPKGGRGRPKRSGSKWKKKGRPLPPKPKSTDPPTGIGSQSGTIDKEDSLTTSTKDLEAELQSRYRQVCEQSKDPDCTAGERVKVCKDTMRRKLQSCVPTGSTATAGNTLPAPGTTVKWGTPEINIHRGGRDVAMHVVHVEEFTTPGTHWREVRDRVATLNGEKYKDLRTKLAQAGTCKLEGTTCSTGLRLSKEKLESCNVEDIKYTDVIHVAGKFYQPVSSTTGGGYRMYLRRCRRNLEQGMLQMGFTHRKDPDSMAECLFTPRVFTVRSSELSRTDLDKIKDYLLWSGIWSPDEVRLLSPTAVVNECMQTPSVV